MYHHKEDTKKMYEQGISHEEGAKIIYELMYTEFKKDDK